MSLPKMPALTALRFAGTGVAAAFVIYLTCDVVSAYQGRAWHERRRQDEAFALNELYCSRNESTAFVGALADCEETRRVLHSPSGGHELMRDALRDVGMRVMQDLHQSAWNGGLTAIVLVSFACACASLVSTLTSWASHAAHVAAGTPPQPPPWELRALPPSSGPAEAQDEYNWLPYNERLRFRGRDKVHKRQPLSPATIYEMDN